MAIGVISILIITAIFFAYVANKVAGVDHKISDFSNDIHKDVEKNVNTLAVKMHDDFKHRGKLQEEKLNQIGDAWRSSLDKTVADVKGEIGKLKTEATQNNVSLREEVLKIMHENAVDFHEQITQVRDNNTKEIQKYQDHLTQQVREYAHKEHETLNKVLNDISGNVKGNLNDLVDNQKEAIKNITTTVGSGYTALAQKVETDINKSTGTATDTLASISQNINTSINEVNTKVNKDLHDISDQLTANLTEVNSKVDTTLSNVSTSLTKNMGDLSTRLNEDINTVTTNLDKSVTDVSSNLNQNVDKVSENLNKSVDNVSSSLESNVKNITDHMNKSVSNVEERIDAGLGDVTNKYADGLLQINKNMDKGIHTLNVAVDDNFDKVGEKVNQRIQDDMKSLKDVFEKFASKVHAIEETREKIENLTENVNILSQVLDDRRSRGNLGETLIESIVSDNLSPNDYELYHELSSGIKVDCVLKLPKPTGNLAINTKIDLSDLEIINAPNETNENRDKARVDFHKKLKSAIKQTADKCIIENETAEAALLLLPSESAFSEAHVHHRNLVDESYKKQVWLASPSTLIAMVTVARAVIKDSTARNEVIALNKEIIDISKDYQDLESNVQKMTRNIDDLLTHSSDTRIAARRIGDRFDQLHSIIRKNPDYNQMVDDVEMKIPHQPKEVVVKVEDAKEATPKVEEKKEEVKPIESSSNGESKEVKKTEEQPKQNESTNNNPVVPNKSKDNNQSKQAHNK